MRKKILDDTREDLIVGKFILLGDNLFHRFFRQHVLTNESIGNKFWHIIRSNAAFIILDELSNFVRNSAATKKYSPCISSYI